MTLSDRWSAYVRKEPAWAAAALGAGAVFPNVIIGFFADAHEGYLIVTVMLWLLYFFPTRSFFRKLQRWGVERTIQRLMS